MKQLCFVFVGKSRDIKEEERYRENCVRRNTFLNVSYQLQRKGGWRLLVMQLKERLGRRECDEKLKGLVPLKEFQKYDSSFPTYLKGISTCITVGTMSSSNNRCMTPQATDTTNRI